MSTTSEHPPSVADKRRAFHDLHRSGCFVIPNPWDIGSARYLESLHFKALATTSSGFAWSQGLPDYGITREMAIEHLRALVAATRVPVNADFQSGFARDAHGVGESVALAVATGVAGLSIEDSTGDDRHPLYDVDTAVERIRAARRAIDAAGGDTLLVGRAEGYLVGKPNLEETIARLKAYSNAGADCLYAPGVGARDQIAAMVSAIAPKPFNLLIGGSSPMTVKDIEALGVRRISVGGALARSAWGAFTHTANLIAEKGSFEGFADAMPGKVINALFADHALDSANQS
jgi:2-methylisocitrate lyase-like PEP mutase family enzyme